MNIDTDNSEPESADDLLPRGEPITVTELRQAAQGFTHDRAEVLVEELARSFFAIRAIVLAQARMGGDTLRLGPLSDPDDQPRKYHSAEAILKDLHAALDEETVRLGFEVIPISFMPDRFFNAEDTESAWKKNLEINTKDTGGIPRGGYCYKQTSDWKKEPETGTAYFETELCPYWDNDHHLPDGLSGYCAYLQYGDWMTPSGFGGLLWDQVKICRINMGEEDGEVIEGPSK